MKKISLILLLLALCTSSLYSQELQSDDAISPEGGTGTRGQWNYFNLKYYIHNYASSLTSSECETAIQNAFNTWSQYTNFTFTRTYNLSQADIALMWDANHFSQNPSDLAFSLQGTTNPLPAYIYYNPDKTFTITSSDFNLQAVTLREIGHVLGLPFVNNSSAVMDGNYHYYTDLTSYDLIAFYDNLYAFPGFITGPRLVSQTGYYDIINFPSGLYTSWSLSNSNYNNDYNHFTSNYPSVGHCRIIRNNNYDLMNDTLKAYIKKGNVIILSQPLTKIVSAYSGFKGQYTSGNLSGNINYTYYFSVRKNATTYITSANLVGATASYDPSATVPSSWNIDPTNGTLNFFVPSNSSTPVVIYLTDGCGNSYQLYAAPTGYYSINISNEGNCITVMLVEDGDASKDFTPSQSWTLEVRNASTGVLMATQSSASRSETISTVGWPKGIYVVKATVGDEELTEKVIVK